MDEQGLRFIADPAAKTLVLQMLAAIVDRPDVHHNRFKYQNAGGGEYTYFVASKRKGSVFPQYSRLRVNVVDLLRAHGWVENNREPGHVGEMYSFTDDALNWYRNNSGPSDEQVQAEIGRYFKQLEEDEPNEPHRFDAEVVARKLEIEEKRVVTQTNLLVGAGLLDDTGPGGSGVTSFYELSRPVGFLWAAAGFGPIAGLGSTTVNVQVDVTINIRHFLLDVGALAIPKEVKQEAADAADQLQRQPSLEKIGKLMELGANTATLVPAILRFFVENGPALQQFFQ
ncbi:MAG: hypothetical protein M3457_04370 [Chloroflexota bacterium]|nr:hypothetical protein [Chloroflexota bacterium]